MLALTIIIGAIFLRLVPHMPNFAPISAIALFGGANLNKRLAILVPLVAMAISDYLLLYVNLFGNPMVDFSHIQPVTAMFHSTSWYVWGSFVISGLIGIWLEKHSKLSYMVAGSFLASLQFFVITNFGGWAEGMYSRGWDGLWQSYIMGLPFLKWTILGDLFYTGIFFGTYELALKAANESKSAFHML